MTADKSENRELKRIGVEIDSQLWDEFRAFVKTKYKRTHGVLSIEVEEALKTLMDDEGFLEAEHSPTDPDHDHDQDTLDRHVKKETHTPQQEGIHKQNQPSETDAYIASINPKYVPIMAELQGHNQIRRDDFEGILTRKLHLTTDKSRREHLKTFEHLGILEPHPEVGHKILTVNQDNLDFSP